MGKLEDLSNLPQCAGVINGTFMRITKPNHYGVLYWCYKGYSIIIIACPCRKRWDTHVCRHWCTWQRKSHSGFQQQQPKVHYLKWCVAQLSVFAVGQWRSEAVPGSRQCLCFVNPCDEDLPWQWALNHASFNASHICTQRVVQCAFGRMKKCFEVISNAKISGPLFATQIGHVCCALHNTIERRQQGHLPWLPGYADYAQLKLNHIFITGWCCSGHTGRLHSRPMNSTVWQRHIAHCLLFESW